MSLQARLDRFLYYFGCPLLDRLIIVMYMDYSTGLTCSDPCPRGTWGINCAQPCQCGSNITCDPVTGDCDCAPGYKGSSCLECNVTGCLNRHWRASVLRYWIAGCPRGYYGKKCSHQCIECPLEFCYPHNGSCICSAELSNRNCILGELIIWFSEDTHVICIMYYTTFGLL
jgi:hypothetical protein